MPYPNEPYWSAMRHGLRIEVNGDPYVLEVVDCGTLQAPHGQLVACDPFVTLEPENNLFIPIPPGTYPVYVTVADVSGVGDGSHLREAYATLVLRDAEEVTRRIVTPLPDDEITEPEMDGDEYCGFPVDSGTACFVDGGSLPGAMPALDTWSEIFDNGTPESWFSRMDDPGHIRAGLANIVLPRARHGENIILVHSGWGDGFFPVVGGYDAQGNLVRVHIDFMVVFPDPEAEE
ncbi:MAG TPA: DUF4241 domain-containing protein [Longimicrobium sp.]